MSVGPHWTEAEDAVLRSLWGVEQYHTIGAAIPQRTFFALKQRARMLGLRRPTLKVGPECPHCGRTRIRDTENHWRCAPCQSQREAARRASKHRTCPHSSIPGAKAALRRGLDMFFVPQESTSFTARFEYLRRQPNGALA